PADAAGSDADAGRKDRPRRARCRSGADFWSGLSPVQRRPPVLGRYNWSSKAGGNDQAARIARRSLSTDAAVARHGRSRRQVLSAGRSAMKNAVVIDCVRTPIGRSHKEKGWFRDVRSDDLAVSCVKTLIERTGIDPALVEDVVLGNTQQTGEQGLNA